MKPTESQYRNRIKIGLTDEQSKSLKTLQRYGVNVNDFIRQAIRDKIKSDWPEIKRKHLQIQYPF